MNLRGWLWRIARRALAAVLEAGALYFDAVNDRQHIPPEPKPCRHTARRDGRCVDCEVSPR